MTQGLSHIMSPVQVTKVKNIVLLAHQVLHHTLRAQTICKQSMGFYLAAVTNGFNWPTYLPPPHSPPPPPLPIHTLYLKT